jgi:ABC-type multidrug transport system fused ATPase/permease subunit
LVVAALTLLLCACAVVLRNKINPSLLGIALVNMMELGSNLKGIIVQWSTLETSLGAVTRIKEFTENAPVEIQPEENTKPGATWPSRGDLQLKNVSVQYE